MQKNRVKLSTIIKNQLPQFVIDSYPVFAEFLSSYYESQEYVGSPIDILTNIDNYIKPENITNVTKSTNLRNSITETSSSIQVDTTNGFPDSYGLLRINDEIITYRSKTSTEFKDCIRGLSSIDSWDPNGTIIFTNTLAKSHTFNSEVENLSVLFFDILFTKLKKQFLPGFENLSDNINKSNFLKNSKYFYKSKGTDKSFKILFKALYGEDVSVIRPSEFLLKPSNSFNKITKNIVVESLEGDPTLLVNRTLYQDEYSEYGIKKSYGTISGVEKIFLDGREYYTINLDFGYYRDISVDGTVYGEFSPHPKTKIILDSTFSILSNGVIDVDSTIGFPNSGTLIINGSSYTYNGKSINQFYEVTGGNTSINISDKDDVYLDVYAYGETDNGLKDIKVRITPIIKNLKILEDTYYMSSEDTAKIKSLGYESLSNKSNDWIFNYALKYEVKEVRSGNILDLYDNHNFKVGDKVKVVDNFGITSSGNVTSIDDENSIVVSSSINFIRGRYYTVYRNILKNDPNANFDSLDKYSTNVQNTYVKSYNEDVLVASSSIPFYNKTKLEPNKKKFNFWTFGTTIGDPSVGVGSSVIPITTNRRDHGFQTGDAVYYTPYSLIFAESAQFNEFEDESISNYDLTLENGVSLSAGVYYAKRVNETSIKLANSLADLYQQKFVTVYANIPQGRENIIEYYPFYQKTLKPQNILREFKQPLDAKEEVATPSGSIAIFINGTELTNYKSNDSVYYGSLENILITSPGFGYDITNPPDVIISDSIGFGATATCSIIGSLDRIEIIDRGFDYYDDPVVQITGGNGFGASAKAEMKLVPHTISFDSVTGVNTISNTIGFSTYHKFKSSEKIIYRTKGQSGVVGLVTDSSYYVSLVDFNTITLHNSEIDANSGINTISLDFGNGIHFLETKDSKKVVSRILVENPGSGYENKKRIISSSGINTASNSFYFKNHGYNSREVVVYNCTGSPISGLSSSQKYVVTKIDDNNFRVSEFGVTDKYDLFNKKQYFNIVGLGTGEHSFNYEPIQVSLIGKLKPSPVPGEVFDCKIQPVFRGQINSIDLIDKGSFYGTPDILNYNRQPSVSLSRGTNAQVLPIVNNGEIVEVLILNGGSEYKSIPNLIVEGSGNYQQLTPIIENGELVEVKVINGGIGFNGYDTRISIASPGEGCRVETNIKKWTINLVEKDFNNIKDDDGMLVTSVNSSNGLQYTHLYAPRKLRESIFVSTSSGETLYGISDLIKSAGNEVNSNYHSPIIGWAYDGNPIYGPYAYENADGTGRIIQMISGYTKVSSSDRPTLSGKLGFFVEDYQFTNSGTLDECNGRFCITPEYPKGVYAYFTTFERFASPSNPFLGYKVPQFPYVIGNYYKSQPNNFNFDRKSNQNEYDINKSDWFRNTTPYILKNNYSGYDYIFNPNEVKICDSEIKSSTKGKIDGVEIISGGSNYQVDDKIIFEEPPTFTYPSSAKVTKISGRTIDNITVGLSTINNIEFSALNDKKYVGYSSVPHNLDNNYNIIISGLTSSFKPLQNNFKIEVSKNELALTVGVATTGVTGIVTYFDVSGNLDYDKIRENDILSIGSENVKVLNIDKKSSRIKVIREFNSTVGSSYSISDKLIEIPRKFYINLNSLAGSPKSKNKEYYFDPIETLGLGTSYGVGIGATLVFNNPGIGVSQLFIPTKSLFLEEHGLNTGDELIYSYGDGSAITVSNGSTTFNLLNNQSLYALKISNNLIGLSTVKSPLNILNCLFYAGIGSGQIHSFKTAYPNTLYGNLERYTANVSLSSTFHNLQANDIVSLNANILSEKNIIVEYNDYNRRLVVDPKSFISSGVNTVRNSIQVLNHGYRNGEKIIHISSSPCLGLVDNQIYYVNVIDKDTITLSNHLHETEGFTPREINIRSQSFGTLYQVNPEIKVSRNQSLKFDLSHPSLSFTYSSTKYSSFEFNIFKDIKNLNEFISSTNTNDFEVIQTGRIGIDTNCNVTLKVSDSVSKILYYNLIPAKNTFLPDVKKQIIIDDEIFNNNQIQISNSVLSGDKVILGIGTSSFEYDIERTPEGFYFDSTNSVLSYDTSSLTEYGSISKIKILNSNDKYDVVPKISNIVTKFGSDAIIDAISTSIGKVKSSQIINNGFDFSSDNTLRPFTIIPYTMKILPLSSFDTVSVISPGKNYTVSPDLIVIDSVTKNIVDDVDLVYTLGKPTVRIFKNTSGFYNAEPTIIPINNSNGVGISSITFNTSSKDVVVALAASFSTGYFPFAVGDKVLVENVSISGIDTQGKGYNSNNYNYELFEISAINPNFGGFGATVTYNMKEFLSPTEYPGTYDPTIPLGRIINQKDFPVFKSTLKKNDFIIGETVEVIDSNTVGVVEKWNPNTEFLKVSSDRVIENSDIVIGKTSKTRGFVRKVYHFISEYELDSSSVVNYGNQDDSGFLNNSTQKLHDNFYYQQFSYSLKSKKSLDEWSEIVDSLNHTSGFIKFSDLTIESLADNTSIVQTPQDNDVQVVNDIINVIDLESVPYFDMVTENRFNIFSKIFSNRIIFKTRDLTDYFESIGNRVLQIDDISGQFNREPRSTPFSSVDIFDLGYSSKKYFVYIKDKNYYDERQLTIVSLLHDNTNAFLNQYGRVETQSDLGYFDFRVYGTGGQLVFYPTKYTFNDYDISFISYDLRKNISSIGNTVSLGNVAKVESNSISYTSPSTILGISSNYRSAKIIVNHVDQYNNLEFDEINLIHNGVDVDILEYGQLTDISKSSFGDSGLGTYHAYISGSNINLDFHPNPGLAITSNSLYIGIANSISIFTDRIDLGDVGELKSNYSLIPSSPTPYDTVIGSYFIGTAFNSIGAYDSSYFVISIEDITNNEYQISEVLLVNDWNGGVANTNLVEYGTICTNNTLGTISSRQNLDHIELIFTQIPNADIQVRVFQNSLKLEQQPTTNPQLLNLNNSRIVSSSSSYQGTNSAVKYSFNLKHQQNEIFERTFVGNSTSIIDIEKDAIKIPNHYFVTGEKLKYSVLTIGGSPIGIATTTVAGIGLTDKLPEDVYAVKVNESSVRLSLTAEDALQSAPRYVDITSVGIGSSHILKSQENKNSRVLITIDNVIQSPIVSTAISERLVGDISISDNRLTLTGITSFSSSDFIKIDDEIMKINSVGFGSTNVILVTRPLLGTGLATHVNGSVVTKIKGSYNIVDNIINFAEPPRGLVPPESNDFKSIFNLNYDNITGVTTVTTVLEHNFNLYEQIIIAGSEIEAFNGYYNIIDTDNIRNFVIDLPSGIVGIPSGDLYTYSPFSSSAPNERDWIGISSSSKFHGRVFMKSGDFLSNYSTYSKNYVFDDISSEFNAIDTDFTLKSNRQDISGISTSNAIILINNIFQGPQSTLDTPQNYQIIESVGVSTIKFVGSATSITYDPNNASIPVGGIIVSVGSSSGFGYQPLISAGGTAVVSTAGTIQSVSIGNSGSGYRSGIQTTVNVSVATTENLVGISTITKIGIASISNGNVISVTITNPGSGYTSSNPPLVIFDQPLSYSNIPLIYSSSSSGIGTQATVDIIVGQGSSVINFELKNTGYGYNVGDILTFEVGGPTGIPTNSTSVEEFKLFVDDVYQDEFSGWFIGDLLVLDEIDNLFDNSRVQFPLSIDGNLISIKARPGSNIDVASTLLVFVNDILQIPGESYIFDGGSIITFTEPLKSGEPGIERSGDRCKILFYRGNGDLDVEFRDIWETVKVGDGLTIVENERTCRNSTTQDQRIVYDILSSDLVETNSYSGPGINDNPNCIRPVTWTRQREDLIINGSIVGKDREMYEPIINPLSNIIQPVSTSSTIVYVQNLKTFFDPKNEDLDPTLQKKITLVSQEDVKASICTAFISSSGIVTGISILDGGRGYTTAPEISIESPSGITSYKATAIASITAGIVTNITITNSGYGYTYTPSILIESPTINVENIGVSSFIGDFGTIVGISTTSFVGVNTGINFDILIPNNSFLLSTSIVGTAITLSSLEIGDYFTVYNTNVGNSVTSLYQSGSVLGIGTQYLDNTYQVSNISTISTSVPGYGVTTVNRVSVSVLDYNGFVGVATTSFLGEYSWGKVILTQRLNPKEFNSYNTNGVTGLSTSAILKRSTRLKYIQYKL